MPPKALSAFSVPLLPNTHARHALEVSSNEESGYFCPTPQKGKIRNLSGRIGKIYGRGSTQITSRTLLAGGEAIGAVKDRC
jgi:hypothetical protein